MIELTDNINWNNFLAELKPESWYKRREGEGNVDWIKRVAIKDSGWLERANERKRNRYWNKESSKFCLSVLSFLRENSLKKENIKPCRVYEFSGKYYLTSKPKIYDI